MKVTRAGIADAKAIVPAGDAVGSEPSEPAEAANPAFPIRALVGRVELAIPAGASEPDIAAAMRAAASL